MTEEQDKAGLFQQRKICIICEGTGMVEVCSTQDQRCDDMQCMHCNGKGYLIEYNKGRIAFALMTAVALVTIAVLLIS